MEPPLHCSRCTRLLDASEFSPATTNRGYQRWCKRCMREYARARRPLLNERQNASRRAAPSVARVAELYGLSPEQYQALLSEQGGVCAICRQPETETGRVRLSVDHVDLGDEPVVRGLLCARHNRALGHVRGQDHRVLRRAAAYLAAWRAPDGATAKELSWLRQCSESARKFSTCDKAAYYAVVLDADGYHLAQGWNGPAPGAIHCTSGGCEKAAPGCSEDGNYDNCIGFHAEEGAILRAPHERRTGGTLVVNGPPCRRCSALAVAACVSRVVFLDDDSYEGFHESYLGLHNVRCVRVKREDLYPV